MTEQMWISIAIQIPLVAAFMWFVLEINKQNAAANKLRNEQIAAENQRRDEEWRTFLKTQQEQNTSILGRFIEELRFHGSIIQILNAALLAKSPEMAKTIVELQQQQKKG